jgi:UDP-galactopyranose mutase
MILIVGAGLSGATIAEHYARRGEAVTVIDKRDHLAGNVYDHTIEDIRVSKYGAHLFHTNDEGVWEYVNRFAKWKRWDHSVIADVDGTYVPIPVNINTVNALCGTSLQTEDEMNAWLKSVQYTGPINNSEDVAKSRVGSELYELLFRQYTIKQWDKEPRLLDQSVLARIPVRNNFDGRYFSDKYQALPAEGYTKLVENMLNHPLITLKLNYDWEVAKKELTWDTLIFTGPIDMYFKNAGLPALEYRSIDFEWETLKMPGYHQPNSVVNYPLNSTPYTRCVEYKHFLHQKSEYTVICKERTANSGEPYYPVPTASNQLLFEQYKKLAEAEPNVHFIGRLASYKYFNMDQAIRNAMDYFTNL